MAGSQDDIDIPSPSVFLRPSTPVDLQPSRVTKPVRRLSKTKLASIATTAASSSQSSKPKQSKSRNGCSTCKAKRLKCDEGKPGCQQCAKRKVECGGYKKDFKWRPFDDSTVKVNIERQKKASSPAQPLVALSQSSSPVDELVSLASPESFQAQARKLDKPSEDARATKDSIPTSPQIIVNAINPLAASPDTDNRNDDYQPEIPQAQSVPKIATPPSTKSPQLRTSNTTPTTLRISLQPQICLNGSSSTLTELPVTFLQPSSNDDDFIPFQVPDDFGMPFLDDFDLESLSTFPLLDDDSGDPSPAFTLVDDEVEDILRQDQMTNLDRLMSTIPSEELSLDAGQVYGLVDYLYNEPNLAPDSPEMLCLRFDRLTCGILSVMDGPTENPWRTLIWPLTQQSPALYHAIAAMTAYHSSADVPILRLSGHEHKQASIRYIQEGIRDNSMTDQTAIATALALGFSESWDQHTASGNTHIKGAQALVKRALAEHKINPLQGEELARLKFLCNAWVYMDVIARLTAVDSDDSNDFDNAFLFSADAPTTSLSGEVGQSGFGIDFGMPIDARLDPLMGCASTLFPLIGRVANLIKKVFRSQSNSPGVISQANDLKLLLETWDPPAFIEPPEDPSSQVQHALQTAEAYRWATLLHLHQSVPELPSLSSAELSQKVLTYIATVPLASRAVIVQIYPLMLAGCEAATQEDRQWVKDRWAAMHTRMRIGVIEKCSVVTEEVWRRRDCYETQPARHRNLVATADLQTPRPGSGKLKRTYSSFLNTAPGRNGIVFSWADTDAGSPGEEIPRTRCGMARGTIGTMDPAYTVRGHLHWVGVMFEWQWEVLLG